MTSYLPQYEGAAESFHFQVTDTGVGHWGRDRRQEALVIGVRRDSSRIQMRMGRWVVIWSGVHGRMEDYTC